MKRFVQMIPILFMISVISFIIIQLPPGSYLNTLIAQMRATGDEVDMELVEALILQLDEGYLAQRRFWPFL
jgi:peptide/nickel transport system permease protein